MARSPNTDVSGKPFGRATIGSAWNNGRIIQGIDPDILRYDVCGKPMKFSDYGKTNSEHGWEIDHIKTLSKGGSDDLANLQPLQWDNNRKKGDAYPWNST